MNNKKSNTKLIARVAAILFVSVIFFLGLTQSPSDIQKPVTTYIAPHSVAHADQVIQRVFILSPGLPTSATGLDFYTIALNPVSVMPRSMSAGRSSKYDVMFAPNKAIPSGGTINVFFPEDTTFEDACYQTLTTFNNADINGPSDGVIAIAYITCDTQKRSVTIATTGGTIRAGDMVRIELQGIKNPTTAKDINTTGYTATLSTKDAQGNILDLLTALPYYISASSSLFISGTVFVDNGEGVLGFAGDGVQSGSEKGLKNARVCAFGTSFWECDETDDNGLYRIEGVSVGSYTITIEALDNPLYISATSSKTVRVESNTGLTGVNFPIKEASTFIQVNITGIPTNVDLNVRAYNSSSSGGTSTMSERAIVWNGSAQRTVTLPVGIGQWDVFIETYIPKDSSITTTALSMTKNFTIPKAKRVSVSASGTYRTEFALQSLPQLISAKAVDSSNLGIQGVFISARPAFSSETIAGEYGAQTDINGNVSLALPLGTFVLSAYKSGLTQPSDMEITVTTDSGNTSIDRNGTCDVYSRGILITNDGSGADNLVFPFKRGAYSIAGRVTDSSQSAIAYAHVSAEKVDASGNPMGEWVEASTDQTGLFVLYVGSGKWTLRAFGGTQGMIDKETVTVTAQNVSDVILSASGASRATVTGTATSQGTALAGAMVHLFGPEGGNGTVTDANGSFSLQVPAGSGYTLSGFMPGKGGLSEISNITLSANQTLSAQNLTLSATGLLSVTIQGITDAFVRANDASGKGDSVSGTSVSGAYEMTLPAGEYMVSAGSSSLGVIGMQKNVWVYAGKTTSISISPPNSLTISGTVTSSSSTCISGANVMFQNRNNGFMTMTTVQDNGTFQATVASGEYDVSVRKPGCIRTDKPKTVSVGTASISGVNLTLARSTSGIQGKVTLNGANITVDTTIIARDTLKNTVTAYVDTEETAGYNMSLNVSAGTWTITAYADGYESAATSVTVANGQTAYANIAMTAIAGYTITEKTVTPLTPSQGGFVRNPDMHEDVAVYFPAGALGSGSSSGYVETKNTTAIIKEDNDIRVVGGAALEITPKDSSGQPISALSTSGVTVTYPYSDDDVSALGVDEENVVMASWSTEKELWEPLSTTVDSENNTLTALVTHFSLFAPVVSVGESGGGSSDGSAAAASGMTQQVSPREQSVVIQEESKSANEQPIVQTKEINTEVKKTESAEKIISAEPAQSIPVQEESQHTSVDIKPASDDSTIEQTKTESIETQKMEQIVKKQDVPEVKEKNNETVQLPFIKLSAADGESHVRAGMAMVVEIVTSKSTNDGVIPFAYTIKNEHGETVFNTTETIAYPIAAHFNKTFHLGENLNPGTYTLSVAYNEGNITASNMMYFEVENEESKIASTSLDKKRDTMNNQKMNVAQEQKVVVQQKMLEKQNEQSGNQIASERTANSMLRLGLRLWHSSAAISYLMPERVSTWMTSEWFAIKPLLNTMIRWLTNIGTYVHM